MNSMRYVLVCWMILQLLLLFPIQSKAEEGIQESDIGTTNQQDVQNNKQPREEIEYQEKQQEEQEQKIETELGVVTVSKQQLIPREKLEIAIEPKEQNVKSITGALQLQVKEGQYEQKRPLTFQYEEETKKWVTSYTVGAYDLEGEWHLQLMQQYEDEESKGIIEKETRIPLVNIKNEAPTLDKELPRLEQLIVANAKDGVIERKNGDMIEIRVEASDAESIVKEVRVILKGEEPNNDITFLLDYQKHKQDWRKVYEVTEAMKAGRYHLHLEIVDAVGNRFVHESSYIISVLEQVSKESEEPKEQVQEEEQTEEPIKEEKVAAKEEMIDPIADVPKKQEEPKQPEQEVKQVQQKKGEKDNQTVSKQKKQVESKKEKKQPKEEGLEASQIFLIMAGLFALFFVVKSNKEWS
ncbi:MULTISPECIES: transglycosylase [Bacillus cereus group]|uniref:transglycosylase n=1 Tax=Bacillus cereus group TaxID=86661 RepID=UPI001F58769D|nr:transglycosylase [Bacillus cereus group sp. BfR-BA-01522]